MQREAVRLSRKNDNVRPFETGGEVELEYLARKADTGDPFAGNHLVHICRNKTAFLKLKAMMGLTWLAVTAPGPKQL